MAEEKSTFDKFKTGVGTFGNALYKAGMAMQGVPLKEEEEKGIDTLKLMEFKMQRDILSQLGFKLPDMTPGDLGITIPSGVTAESALNQFRGGQAQQMPGQPTGPGGMVASSATLDAGPLSVKYEQDPLRAASEKANLEKTTAATEQATTYKSFGYMWKRSRDEMNAAGIDTASPGWIARAKREIQGRAGAGGGSLPHTSNMITKAGQMTLELAKQSQGTGRVSDRDAKMLQRLLMDSFQNNDITNFVALANMRNTIKDKGGVYSGLDQLLGMMKNEIPGADKALKEIGIGIGSTGNYTIDDLFAGVK